jgi:3-deoxy-D-manno-octulosonate 8-phosphate phosphatase (KDO 8-P phosphatase)
MRPSPAVVARARRVRLLVMDVDGVLTDGRMFLSERGDELKAFHSRDGVAVALAMRAGLHTAIVTGERATVAKARGEKLGVEAIVLGARRKGETLEDLAVRFGVSAAETAFIGDDLLDVPALQRAGLAVAVADAVAEARRAAHVVLQRAGGRGAVRECVELILRAQGVWRSTVARYVADHGGVTR